jgi:hypothetical protein
VSDILKNPGKLLAFILNIIAFHSFAVGVALILQPQFLMEFSGFGQNCQRFFPTQGGVFHIVMAICYTMAALDPEERRCMVVYSIIAKSIATFFLLTYFFAIDAKWVILLSGIGDGLMGIVIYMAHRNYLTFSKNQCGERIKAQNG